MQHYSKHFPLTVKFVVILHKEEGVIIDITMVVDIRSGSFAVSQAGPAFMTLITLLDTPIPLVPLEERMAVEELFFGKTISQQST